MFYSSLLKSDLANGPGVRVTLFVSGCPHHCPGCFNPETWDYSFGKPYTEETKEEILSLLSPSHIAGLTLLGGEPMVHDAILTDLAKTVKSHFPEKDIWCYTGYTFEEIQDKTLLPVLDVLVDGPFVLSKKNPALAFRGSDNQRIIDVKATLASGHVIEMEV